MNLMWNAHLCTCQRVWKNVKVFSDSMCFRWLNIRGVSAFTFRQGQQRKAICIFTEQQPQPIKGTMSRFWSPDKAESEQTAQLGGWSTRISITWLRPITLAERDAFIHPAKTKRSRNAFISLNQPRQHAPATNRSERLREFLLENRECWNSWAKAEK